MLLDFPFTDASGSKRRPAIVLLDTGDVDVVVAPITSQFRGASFDVAISQWRAAGLRKAAIVRLHKVTTVKRSLIHGRLGVLHRDDRHQVGVVLERTCQDVVTELRR